MLAKKTVLAAAALAALTALGFGSASAQPRDHFRDHRATHHVVIHKDVHRPAARHHVDRAQVYRTLRQHRYTGLGNPYFLRGQYVVRSHDRFGRVVLVRIDPWTGRFIGTVRL